MQPITYWYKGGKGSNASLQLQLSFGQLPFDYGQLNYCHNCRPAAPFTNQSLPLVDHQNQHLHQSQNKQGEQSTSQTICLTNSQHSQLSRYIYNKTNTITFGTNKLLDKISTYLDYRHKNHAHITHNKHSKTKLTKFKLATGLSSMALVSISVIGISNSIFNSSKSDAYSTVMATKTLTLASVAGDSTFFATDGFEHGFGYDIARSYANELGVELKVKNYANEVDALKAVSKGKADMALTTASTKLIESNDITSINISCGFDSSLTQNGLNPKTSWSFRSNQDPLAVKASHFLCHNDQLISTAKIANFYDQTLLKDDYNRQHFEQVLTTNLPLYKSSFQEQAKNYDHDWQLLVAMGYQESHLDANAVSPTGVKGLMMLTNNTAEAMGVSNRIDPYQSIGGGARYLEQLKQSFSDIPDPDRTWFALASYNMGPNAIRRIQNKLSQAGKDPSSWANVYSYMLDNAASNSRYVQCMHYVTNIRSYLESLKTRTT